ncbi:MAG: hypothetical protein J7M34_08625 [Anaerolineae bacterium]|nr:hypothetical protein [Anaerolineae bacterium]
MSPKRRDGLGAALFILLFTLYFLSSSGGFHIVDEVSLFAVTESVAKRGAFDTNIIAWTQWVNSPGEVLGAFGPTGDVYSKKGPALALLAVPLYVLAWAIPGVGLIQATLLYNALVTSLTALLLMRWALRLGYRRRVALAVALSFGLGTLAWPYATHYFGEPTSALCLVGAGYALTLWRADGRSRWALAAGLALAGMIATVTAHAVLIPIFLGCALWDGGRHWRRPDRPSAVACLIPLAVAVVGLAAYNWARFGNPLQTGYHFEAGEGWTTPLWRGLWGLLFSPYRGLIWYTPLSVGAVLAWRAFWREHRNEAALIAGVTTTVIVLYSLWWMWWGGFAWGPRFLVPLCPFLALALAPWWARLFAGRMTSWGKVGFLGLIGLSALVQVLAVIANYAQYEIELRDIYPTDWSNPLRYGPPDLYNPLHSPILGQIHLLARDLRGSADLFWLRPDAIVWGVPLGGAIVLALAGFALWRAARERSARRWLPVLMVAFLLWSGYALTEASHDPRFGRPGEGYRAALNAIEERARPGDVIVTVAPYHYHVPMDHYRGKLPIYGYAQESPVHRETARVLSRLLGRPRNVWFITGGLPPADPSNGIERWLAERAYKAGDEWFDDFRLVRFLTPASKMTPVSVEDAVFGNAIGLAGAAVGPATVAPGDGIRIILGWVAARPLTIDYVVFAQLLDKSGKLVAQQDSPPAGGYRPTSSWAPGEPVEDHIGVGIPADLPPGDYALIVGIYDPTTGARLPVSTGGDFVTLGRVKVARNVGHP